MVFVAGWNYQGIIFGMTAGGAVYYWDATGAAWTLKFGG